MASKKNEAYIEFKANTSEFQKGIKQMNAELKTASNALRLNSTQLKGTGDSVDLLSERQGILQQELEASTKKVELTEKSLAECEATLGKNSKEYESLSNAVLNAKNQQQAIQNELDQTAEKLSKIENENKQAATSFGQLSDKIDEQENDLASLKRAYADVVLSQGKNSDEAKRLANEIEDLSSELADNKKKMSDAENAADDLDKTLEKVEDSAEDAGEGFTVMKGALADLVADGIKSTISTMGELLTSSDKAFSNFQAQTGASAQEMKGFEGVMQDVYANNFGDSMEDVADAMANIKQQVGDIDPSKLKELTEQALLMRDTFDMDVNESVRAANMLMNQFGLDSTQAYNLIAQGAQNGLNKNDDLLDSINEYSVHYAQQGYSAEQFFNSLKNGTDAGTFSVDKLGDAMKEFGIRTKDNSDATKQAFSDLGLNADDLTKKFAAGGDSAQQATEKTLTALFSMKDEVKQNEIGVALFGTMWEDLGIEGVKALTETKGAISLNKDALEDMNNVKYDNLSDAFSGIVRKIEGEVMPTINEIAPAITGFMGKVTEKIPEVFDKIKSIVGFVQNNFPAFAVIVGGIAAAWLAFNAATMAAKVATALQTAQQWLLNAAMNANPIGLIILAITALVAGFMLLWKNCEGFRNFFINMWEKIKSAFSAAKNGIMSGFDSLKNKISNFKEKAGAIFKAILNFFKSNWKSLLLLIVNPFAGAFKLAWDNCAKFRNKVTSIFNSIKEKILTPLTTAKNKAVETFQNLRTATTEKITAIRAKVISIFNSIKEKITTPINNAKNAAINAFQSLRNGISSRIEAIRNKVSSVFSAIKTKMTQPVEAARDKIKGVVDKIKGFFSNMKLSLPKIKVPKISISGKFSLNPPSVPKFSISWNAKGALFTKPTVFQGLGEAGKEYALPLNERSLTPLATLLNKLMYSGENGLADALASRFDRAIDRLTDKLEKLESRIYLDGKEVGRGTASYADVESGVRARLTERGLAVK